MMRSCLILFLGMLLAPIAGIVGWIWWDWKIGLTVFLGVTGLSFASAGISVLMIRTLSWIDVFFPFVSSIIWTILLLPIKIPTQLFAAPAAIGAGLMLSISFFLYKSKGGSKAWLVIPVGIWLYEMLPISIPGPIDDFFALGGQCTIMALQYVCSDSRKNITQAPPPS